MRTVILVAILIVLALVVCGCNEAQQKAVWGQGELPTGWQSFFGSDNTARLNFVQTNTINKQGQSITELAERVRLLESENPAESRIEAIE